MSEERSIERGFLESTVPDAVATLSEDSTPGWGSMNAQQMLEHLLWALEMSTGRVQVEGPPVGAEVDRLKSFLWAEVATPRNHMNPLLVDGLPPLRFVDLDEAREAVVEELDRFLTMESHAKESHVHPIFGPLSWEEWYQAHVKHFQHHLLQFGVSETA